MSPGRPSVQSAGPWAPEAMAGPGPGDPDEQYDFLFKLVLVGDASVGKTCVVQRFKTGAFSERQGSTIGVDFTMKTLEIQGQRVKVGVPAWAAVQPGPGALGTSGPWRVPSVGRGPRLVPRLLCSGQRPPLAPSPSSRPSRPGPWLPCAQRPPRGAWVRALGGVRRGRPCPPELHAGGTLLQNSLSSAGRRSA